MDEHKEYDWKFARRMMFLFCGYRGIDITGAEIDAFIEDFRNSPDPWPPDDYFGSTAWKFLEKISLEDMQELAEFFGTMYAKFREIGEDIAEEDE